MNPKLRDILERVVATFLLAFIGFVTMTHAGPSVRWGAALGVGLGAAVLCILSTVVVVWLLKLHTLDPLLDLLVRAVLTFVQTLISAMAADSLFNLFTFRWSQVCLAALMAAGLGALKGLAGIANAATAGASVAVPAVAAAPKV